MKLGETKRKCPNAAPTHLHNHGVWSRILKCTEKSHVTGPLTKCYSNEILLTRVLKHGKNKINQQLWAFGVPWSPGFVLGLPPRDGFEKTVQVSMKHVPWTPHRNPCRLCIHHAVTYSLVGPSNVVGRSELGPAPHFFHQWECLKCDGHGLSVSSCVKWPSICRSRCLWWWNKKSLHKFRFYFVRTRFYEPLLWHPE